MDGEFHELLVTAYQGEVLGEELFGRLAERHADDQDHRAKLAAVQRMETLTKERVRSLVDEAGVDCGDDATSRRAGEQAAAALGSMAWRDLMATIGPATENYRDAYARLRLVAPNPDHPVIGALIAHEQALRTFAERELAGRSDDSLAPILEVLAAE